MKYKPQLVLENLGMLSITKIDRGIYCSNTFLILLTLQHPHNTVEKRYLTRQRKRPFVLESILFLCLLQQLFEQRVMKVLRFNYEALAFLPHVDRKVATGSRWRYVPFVPVIVRAGS